MNERKIIRVQDVMDERFYTVDGLATVKDVLAMMKANGAAPIIINKRSDDDEFGICLLSDIARKVLAQDRAPERVNIYEIMSKPVISVRPDMDVRYCARLLEQTHFSVAPVIGNGDVLGVVGYEGLVLSGLLELYA